MTSNMPSFIQRHRTRTRALRAATFVAAAWTCVCVSALATDARAAGLYFSDRGVRAVGRGGAFVAGADDLGAVWSNPAGLADAGTSILLDSTWLNFSTEFKRRTQVVDASGTVRVYEYPTVKGSTPFLPIPTIAGSYAFGDKKQYTLAGAILAPYVPIATYPTTIDGQPSPSRYSLLSMDGSALVQLGGYFAWKPIKEVRIGAGFDVLVGKFASTVVFNANPADRLIGAPEDPNYDATSQLSAGPIFAPSGGLGAVFEPEEHVRIGISGHLPFWISAPATLKVRLPTAAPFDRAKQDGDEGNVTFRLPGTLRAGVEFRQKLANEKQVRIEAAYVREFWSLHDSIDIKPKSMQLLDVTGFPTPFKVAPISLPRNFQDSNSVRLGGEFMFKEPIYSYRTALRAGISYETSAIPTEWVSPLTVDTNKVQIGGGAGLFIGKWRLDAAFSYIFAPDVEVDPATAMVPRVNPVKGNPTASEAINGGTYTIRALTLGGGLNYKFD
jgi:long-chain fatty acid transport protein